MQIICLCRFVYAVTKCCIHRYKYHLVLLALYEQMAYTLHSLSLFYILIYDLIIFSLPARSKLYPFTFELSFHIHHLTLINPLPAKLFN